MTTTEPPPINAALRLLGIGWTGRDDPAQDGVESSGIRV